MVKQESLANLTLRQFLKYVTTGGISFGAEYTMFYMLFRILKLWYIWSNSIAMTFGFTISFFLNRFWSFKSQGNAYRQFIMYGVLFLVNLFISNMLMLLFSGTFGIKPLISKLVTVGILVCWNFVIYKKVIFK
ncbi:MAG: GtrA family protein [Firmicutes bacterium]|nr:GtrA family protein [Bacillota bacterium]